MSWSDSTVPGSGPEVTDQAPRRVRDLAMRLRLAFNGQQDKDTAAALAPLWHTHPHLFALPSGSRYGLIAERVAFLDALVGPAERRPPGMQDLIAHLTPTGYPNIEHTRWVNAWKAADLFTEIHGDFGTTPPATAVLVQGVTARTFDDSVHLALRIALAPTEDEARAWLAAPPRVEDVLAAVRLKVALAPPGRRTK